MTKTESDNILLKCNIYPTKKPSKSTYNIDLGELTHHNVKQLKVINQTIFPVSYNDKFYKDLLEMKDLVRLAYFNDIVVGGVCCRIDSVPLSGDSAMKKIYIMTLGCLAPYRRLGVGKVMLEHVLSIARRESNIESVYLHVQVNNDDALAFYRQNGFEVVQRAENYYKRIEPTDAYVVERKLNDAANEAS